MPTLLITTKKTTIKKTTGEVDKANSSRNPEAILFGETSLNAILEYYVKFARRKGKTDDEINGNIASEGWNLDKVKTIIDSLQEG